MEVDGNLVEEFKELTKENIEFSKKCTKIAQEINSGQLTIVQLVEQLGALLVDVSPNNRELAVLRGVIALAKFEQFPEGAATQILTALFHNVACQQQQQSDRQNIYKIFEILLHKCATELCTMGLDYVYGVISAVDGERDPKNLILLFNWYPKFLKTVKLGHLTEETFEILACYFPVDFKAPPQDPNTITRDKLAEALTPCLTAIPQFAELCFSLALEKIDSSLDVAKLDALKLLKELFNNPKPEVEAACLTTLTAVIKKMSPNPSLNGTVKDISDTVKRNLLPDSRLFEPSWKLLLHVAKASRDSCSFIVKDIAPILINTFNITATSGPKMVVLTVLVQFFYCYMNLLDDVEFDELKSIPLLCLKAALDENNDLSRTGFDGLRQISKFLPPHQNHLLLLDGILSRLRRDVKIDYSVLNILTEVTLKENNDFMRNVAVQLLANLINKCDDENVLQNYLNQFDENVSDLTLLTWLTKALVMRNHEKANIWIDKLVQLLEIDKNAASSFRIIVNDNFDSLSRKSFCNRTLLYQQKFFVVVSNKLSANYRPELNSYLLALGYLLEHTPRQAILLQFKKILKLIILCLDECEENEVLAVILQVIRDFIVQKEKCIEDHHQEFLTRLLKLAAFDKSMKVRILSLKCLQDYTSSFPTYKLLPHKMEVLKVLGKVIDDKKRIVRREAVEARSQWYLLDAPIVNLRNLLKMSSIERIKQNAEVAKQTIQELKSELNFLNNEYNNMLAKELLEENTRLLAAVEEARSRLIQLEMKNGIQQIPVPNQSAAAAAGKPESVPEVAKDAKPPKKEKPKKEKKPQEASAELPVDVGRLDLRIAKVEDVQKHPDADSLYVLKINCGEEKPRTVCSGLVKHVPIEELRDRVLVLLCNLKPVKMRGVTSEAMVMCASCESGVEVLSPPPGCVVGEHVHCEGYTRQPDP
ncbi:aminoacyl tRNA synthase complex-interacting multifunctional protein 1, partial [Asbolus verrucosus]